MATQSSTREISLLSAYANIAEKAAVEAGRIMLRNARHLESLKISAKNPNDFVSETDLACEREILRHLHKAYPDHAVLSEEGGVSGSRDSEYRWIVDPLDGTTNFIHDIPHFAASIALMKNDSLLVGTVYDPCKNELFTATKGGGAMLNNRRIRVADRHRLEGALLGTGIPYSKNRDLDHYLRVLQSLIRDTAGVRRAGAASLDLAYVAAGRLDGFWEYGLEIWDIAAGTLLITEAGGIVGDFDGGHDHLRTGDTLAANPALLKKMLARIDEVEKNGAG